MSKLLSKPNAKLAKSGKAHGLTFASFGIPAAVTCPGADACKAGCYALQGSYTWKPVIESRKRNFEATKDSATFISRMVAEVIALDAKCKETVLCIRIHDSGDFYNKAYLNSWIEIAKSFEHVIFYAYTKSVHLFDAATMAMLPDNFRIIFSIGGKFDHLIDRSSMNHAKVFETVEELKAAGYVDASEDDALAIFGGRNVGLVYHGTKSIDETDWKRAV